MNETIILYCEVLREFKNLGLNDIERMFPIGANVLLIPMFKREGNLILGIYGMKTKGESTLVKSERAIILLPDHFKIKFPIHT